MILLEVSDGQKPIHGGVQAGGGEASEPGGRLFRLGRNDASRLRDEQGGLSGLYSSPDQGHG